MVTATTAALIIGIIAVGITVVLHEHRRRSSRLPNATSKSVLITGCDSGLGQVAALALTDLTLTVFAGCLTEGGIATLKRLRPNSANLVPMLLDVRSQDSIERAKSTVVQSLRELQMDGLWAFISNAAIEFWEGPDDICTVDYYKKTMDVNVFGAIRLCHAFRPLVEDANGRLIFVSSIKGRLVFPENGPYAISKYALEAYAESLRREVAPFGISVHVIQPGGYRTAIMQGAGERFRAQWDAVPEAIKAKYGQTWFENKYQFWSQIRTSDMQVVDFKPAVDTYVHAVIGKYPKNYYIVGNDAWKYYVISLMPSIVQDWYFKYII